MAYFGGHSYREVAVDLALPEGTVKSRIRLALRRLDEILRAELAEEGTTRMDLNEDQLLEIAFDSGIDRVSRTCRPASGASSRGCQERCREEAAAASRLVRIGRRAL